MDKAEGKRIQTEKRKDICMRNNYSITNFKKQQCFITSIPPETTQSGNSCEELITNAFLLLDKEKRCGGVERQLRYFYNFYSLA